MDAYGSMDYTMDDNAGDPMEIDSPSFNPGRRRKFDEFVVDDPEEMVREHRPLHHQLPTTLRRRAGSPPDAPLESNPEAETRNLTWTGFVRDTLSKGTRVVAVVSTRCRNRLSYSTRPGRQVETWRIHQTCNAAVQSSCNAAKRCLVSLSTVIPMPWGLRRHVRPRSPREMVNGQSIPVSPMRSWRAAEMAALDKMPPLLLANAQQAGPGEEMEGVQTTGPEPVVEDVEDVEMEDVEDVEMEDAGPVAAAGVDGEDEGLSLVGSDSGSMGEFEEAYQEELKRLMAESLVGAVGSERQMLDDFVALGAAALAMAPETPSHPSGSFPVQIAPSTPSSDTPSHLGGFSEYPHPDHTSQLPKQTAVDTSIMSVASSSNAIPTPSSFTEYRDPRMQVASNSSTQYYQSGMQTLPNQYSGLGIQTSFNRLTQFGESGRRFGGENLTEYTEEGMQDQSNRFTQPYDESIADFFVEKFSDPPKVGKSPGPEPDNMDDLLSDTTEDGESHLPEFDNMAASSETCDQLVTVHDSEPNSTLIVMDSSHGSSVQCIPQASGIPAQAAVGLPNSIITPATAIDIDARGKHSNLGVLPDPSTPKQAPKKRVAFFASPKTGRPITATKKFILGEPISFPVSSSPPSEASILSMDSGSQLSDNSPTDAHKAETHPANLKHQDADTANDWRQSAMNSNLNRPSGFDIVSSPSTHPEPAGRSQDAISQNEGAMLAEEEVSSQEETTVSVATGSPVVEADGPAMEEQSIAVEDSGSMAGEKVSSLSSSESESGNADHTISLSSHRKRSHTASRTGCGKMPSRTSARRSAKNARQPQNLAVSFSTLEVSDRRGSSRIVARKMKGEARRQEQAAHEAAERARIAKEEEEEKAREEAAAEEERRKNSVRRVPKEKVIQPLNATWEEKVQQALNTPNMRQVLINLSSGATLTRKDLGTLKVVRGRDPAHGWLNDEIIAACLQQVVDYGLRISNHIAGETPKYHAFNTFFYKNLRDKGAQSVKRWASKANIGKEDLLKAERVFIPVHQGAHWTLLVVSPLARTIEYFDSMGGRAAPYILNAKKWLAEELGKMWWKEEEWTVPTGDSGAGPMQENGSDCGVFTCTTARMVVLGIDPMSYGGDDMAVQRSRMVAELLNGGLVGDFEPRVVF